MLKLSHVESIISQTKMKKNTPSDYDPDAIQMMKISAIIQSSNKGLSDVEAVQIANNMYLNSITDFSWAFKWEEMVANL